VTSGPIYILLMQLATEPHRTDITGIPDLPPLPVISYDEFDAEAGSDDSSDLGGAESTA
jgi:hypothetical protein